MCFNGWLFFFLERTRKVQMTLTLEEVDKKYVQDIADEYFEGNTSMSIRKIINEHSLKTYGTEVKQ